MKETLFVFDIDGTLTDSMHHHHNAFLEGLMAIGVTNYIPNQREYKHFTDSYIVKEIFESHTSDVFTDDHLQAFGEVLHKGISEQEIFEVEGAQDLVDLVKNEKNFGFCFATGSLLKPAEYKLQSTSISFTGDQLTASDEIEERERIVEEAIQKAKSFYDADFERIVSLGDGLWDLKTAQNLGLEFIGIGDKHKEIMQANGCELHFENPRKLLEKFPF